jgi:glycosyltransferase involved in cell wall biosynthesis
MTQVRRDEVFRSPRQSDRPAQPATLLVSVVVPFFNEEACVVATIRELLEVLTAAAITFEVVAVDDGSTDRTPELLRALRREDRRLRVFSLQSNVGQSAAFGTGIQHARGQVIVLMDGDGQNDPRDIPTLLTGLDDHDAVCGYRAQRQDTWSKRLGSRLANAVRDHFLHDGAVDSGCSLKVMRAEFARNLPLTLRGMHRFLPALLQLQGARLQQLPVHHRARRAGHSKYSNLGRLRVTIADLRAVRWMQSRHRPCDGKELL